MLLGAFESARWIGLSIAHSLGALRFGLEIVESKPRDLRNDRGYRVANGARLLMGSSEILRFARDDALFRQCFDSKNFR